MQTVFTSFPLVFAMYYIAALVPVLFLCKIGLERSVPKKSEVAIKGICDGLVIIGILLGIFFQVRIAEQPFGEVYGGYAIQLVILLIVDIAASMGYYLLAFRRFKAMK